MRRRSLLAGGTLAFFGLSSKQASGARVSRAEPRRIALQFTHTGAWFRGPFHDGRQYDPGALADFSRVIGDHRTGQVKDVDPRLLDLLWRLSEGLQLRSFACVSGYRCPSSNLLVGGVDDSQHLAARAVDLWFPAERQAEVIDRAVDLRLGGVGAYATFVHLDVGAVRFWDRRPAGSGCDGCSSATSTPVAASQPAARSATGTGVARDPHRIPLPMMPARPASVEAPSIAPASDAAPLGAFRIFGGD